MWWRTRDSLSYVSIWVTPSKTKEFLKSPRFLRSSLYMNNFIKFYIRLSITSKLGQLQWSPNKMILSVFYQPMLKVKKSKCELRHF